MADYKPPLVISWLVSMICMWSCVLADHKSPTCYLVARCCSRYLVVWGILRIFFVPDWRVCRSDCVIYLVRKLEKRPANNSWLTSPHPTIDLLNNYVAVMSSLLPALPLACSVRGRGMPEPMCVPYNKLVLSTRRYPTHSIKCACRFFNPR